MQPRATERITKTVQSDGLHSMHRRPGDGANADIE